MQCHHYFFGCTHKISCGQKHLLLFSQISTRSRMGNNHKRSLVVFQIVTLQDPHSVNKNSVTNDTLSLDVSLWSFQSLLAGEWVVVHPGCLWVDKEGRSQCCKEKQSLPPMTHEEHRFQSCTCLLGILMLLGQRSLGCVCVLLYLHRWLDPKKS